METKNATCGDQNNPDLYGKPMAGKALCLPQTIGSTTGGLVLYCACSMNRQPACLLFSNPIDSLAAAGSVLAAVWLDNISMPVVDSLGQEFFGLCKRRHDHHHPGKRTGGSDGRLKHPPAAKCSRGIGLLYAYARLSRIARAVTRTTTRIFSTLAGLTSGA